MENNRNYIFVSRDAIEVLTDNRIYQSTDFPQALNLGRFLRGEAAEWRSGNLLAVKTRNGAVIITDKLDRKRGILFDLTTFNAFSTENPEEVMSIFNKVLRYGKSYFDKKSPNKGVVIVSDSQDTILFPSFFGSTQNALKVVIDRNSSKQNRNGQNYLTVYYYGNDGVHQKPSFTSLNKLVEEIKDVEYVQDSSPESDNDGNLISPVSQLDNISLPIDSDIGFDNWNQYLTTPQKNFINRPVSGAERLEGAAGTGKTLTMIMRCISLLKRACENDESLRVIFFTHSMSTKDRIIDIFRKNWRDFDNFDESGNNPQKQSILITTLQEWSLRHLGINSLEENECLDKDAEDSKLTQLMYIEEAYDSIRKEYHNMYSKLLSRDFKAFIEDKSSQTFEVLQREFSEVIKGQCKSVREHYLKCERPKFGLRLDNEKDRSYVFRIFLAYQEMLESVGKYDSDDIVLTALGQVSVPIWNRRRINEGYDICFIDETHLFNLNELSLFHHVNKPDARHKIIYAIDKSQAIGGNLASISFWEGEQRSEKYQTVFRNSFDIARLAFHILSSGAALFTTLENPLSNPKFATTNEEESRYRFPVYNSVSDEKEMLAAALEWCVQYEKATGISRSRILVVATDNILLKELERYAASKNKAYVVLKSRADHATLKDANDWQKMVFSHIDYVGGLEFDAVVIIGAEKERVPPHITTSAEHVTTYAWYNRLYVAVTRARYALTFFGVRDKGVSPLLKDAIEYESLEVKE